MIRIKTKHKLEAESHCQLCQTLAIRYTKKTLKYPSILSTLPQLSKVKSTKVFTLLLLQNKAKMSLCSLLPEAKYPLSYHM